MVMPRAQTDAMPMMKATNISAETNAAPRVSNPRTRQVPTTSSRTGSRWPTVVALSPGSSW